MILMKKCLNILLINVQKDQYVLHCNLRDEMYSVPKLYFPVEDARYIRGNENLNEEGKLHQ
jgi:hypothetical protein